MSVQLLGELIDRHRKERGLDPTRGGYSFVVSADGASVFLREIFSGMMPLKHVSMDNSPDNLFYYKNVPVRLRYSSQPGQCFICRDGDVPKRSCCDEASAVSVMVALTRSNA